MACISRTGFSTVYRKGAIVQVWWPQDGPETWTLPLTDANVEQAKREFADMADSKSAPSPSYCPIHQHYKWCEHNGGVLGPNGYEAKKTQ